MAKDKTVDYFKTCFSTEPGRRVLAALLIEAKFFEYTKTPEEQAVENFMKTILTKCGTYNVKNVDAYVMNLMSLKVEQ